MNNRTAPKIDTKALTELQSVSCGLFGVSDDFIEKYQSLDSKFVKNKESTFYFKAIGDSMVPTIFPSDILVVDRSIKNFNGRVCVIAYNDEFVCKRVYQKKDHIVLKSDNSKFKDIIIHDEHSAIVWGVVTARCGEVN
jgi:DNA polymerase V